MNLEEQLRRERDAVPPNPLVDRTDQIVARVRRRRAGRFATAAVGSVAALAVVAVFVGQLLPRETPPAEPSPTGVVSLPAGEGVVVEPGAYVFPVIDTAAWPTMLPVITVPPGFSGTDGGDAVIVGHDEGSNDARQLRIWNVDAVYSHPCSDERHALTVGPTAADLANALAAQPLRAGTTPVPVTIGGYDGYYVKVSVPDDIDIAACPGGKFYSWPGRWQQAPGQVDMLWIVEVEGQRLVFDAWTLPGVTPEQTTQLQQMVTTATFTPTDTL